MPGKLAAAIKQTRPFHSPQEEALLNLLRTSDRLMRRVAVFFEPFGLTGTQYNVLRILRGAESDGLPCGEIAARMIARDPDITRLLDRLEKHGWTTRERETRDRRVIRTRITPAGLDVLSAIDEPLARLHRDLLGHLPEDELRSLIGLLEKARKDE